MASKIKAARLATVRTARRRASRQLSCEREKRIPTSALNRVMRAAFEAHPAPSRSGRRQKFFYATQPAAEPPTFVLYVTDPEEIHFSYRRYLENTIRREYGFDGVPLRISFRGRSGDGKG